MIIILDRGFFSLDKLRLLHKYGYVTATTYSRSEIKHAFFTNIRILDSTDNTIVYNDKLILTMHVKFSVANLFL